MDPTNERRVFELLAQASLIEMPQYFIVTPKLLPGLRYPDDTCVHVVFNGPWMIPQSKWDLQQQIALYKTKLHQSQ